MSTVLPPCLPSSLQGLLPPRTYTGDDTAAWLRDSLLTLRLEGTAAADVAACGERSVWLSPPCARC